MNIYIYIYIHVDAVSISIAIYISILVVSRGINPINLYQELGADLVVRYM